MAYASPTTTYVALNTELPILVRFPPKALGLSSKFYAKMLNRDTREISDVSDFVAVEVGIFSDRTILNGDHRAGRADISVQDATKLSVGMSIRLSNATYTILGINEADQLASLSEPLAQDYASETQVKQVVNPEYLGMYQFTMTPTKIGNFRVSIFSATNAVVPLEEDIKVVLTLEAGNSSGKIMPMASLN
jgi:hypothetical protein